MFVPSRSEDKHQALSRKGSSNHHLQLCYKPKLSLLKLAILALVTLPTLLGEVIELLWLGGLIHPISIALLSLVGLLCNLMYYQRPTFRRFRRTSTHEKPDISLLNALIVVSVQH